MVFSEKVYMKVWVFFDCTHCTDVLLSCDMATLVASDAGCSFRLIKEFDREMQEESLSNPEAHKLLNEKKQSMVRTGSAKTSTDQRCN